MSVAADEVRRFILQELSASFRDNGLSSEEVPDDLDLFKTGIVDSIGLVGLMGSIEDHFGIEVDFEDLDPEKMTILGPLCRYVSEHAVERKQ